MGKTLGYGEITVANMTEPFTVMLTNEAQQFATDSNRKVTSAQSYYTDIIVIRGSQERTDYTIGNITSGSGITVSKNNKRVTFSVNAGATIGADTGVVEIPITLDGQTVKKQFSWSCGKQGPQGVKGQDGTSIKITSKSVTYQTSTSGTTAPTGTWSTTVPTVNNGQYLWTKTTVQYSDGNKTEAYSVSYKGTNGTNGASVTVSKTEVTYQVSTSGTTAPTGTWSKTMPSCDQGQYLWTKTYVKYSDGKETTSYSVSYKGVDGEKFAFNMLRETNQGSKHWENHASGGKYSTESIITEDGINAVKLICTEAIPSGGWQYVSFDDYQMLKSLKPSTDYVISFDIKSNLGTQGPWVSIQQGDSTNAMLPAAITHIKGNETWEHIRVFLRSNDTLPKINGQYIYITSLGGVGYSIIKNLKLTESTTDTPWAPHPEDLEGRGVTEITQWYLATNLSSGVTAGTSGWSTDITTQKITADKKYLWNCHRTRYSDGTMTLISTPAIIGVYGDKGDNAKNLTITPSSQYFKSTDGGKTFAPDTITIKPTIQGEISFGKWQYSIDGGVSFVDVVSGQKGLTISNNVLTVSKDSSLYSDAVTMVTFRAVANDSSFYDTCSVAKIYDVSDIGDGRNLWITRDNITLQACEKDKYIYTTTGTSAVCIGADAASVGTNTIALQTGTKYTISFVISSPSEVGNALWYFCTALNSTGVKNYGGYGVKLVTGENIVSQTITVDTSCDAAGLVLYHLPTGCVIKDIQVEKGSSPTGWTPAPEDIQTAILSTKSEISDVSLKVDKNKQAIEQRVEKTTYQQDLNLVKGDISKANEGLNKWRYEIYPKSLFASEYQGKSTMDVFAKNTNLTPSQSVLINDTDFGKSWAYGDNYIGYALTFVKFSAAKSIAITFKHDDGAHLYLNGKLIGGDDTCNTGSGESLTLSFIQGWNCLEVVLNEKSGGEYIGLGTTISAISECQLMNCYYGTPVARQSHITNQLVQNTTDIEGVSGSVQKVMSTVGGSSKIDEFVNNYSTWKKKVDGIETRVGETYTTKSDFNGLEIGGRNLLKQSSMIGEKLICDGYTSCNNCNIAEYTNEGFHIITPTTGNANNGIAFCFYNFTILGINGGDTITFSCDIKGTSDSHAPFVSIRISDNNWYGSDVIQQNTSVSISSSWQRVSTTITVPTGLSNNHMWLAIHGNYQSDLYIKNFKLEKGNKATDWTPALEDNEINGQNLVSNLPTNWEQGSVQCNTGSIYSGIKTATTTRLRVKDVFSVSGNVTISAGASTNSSKEDLNFYYVLFDVNKKEISNSSTWQSLTSAKIINCGDAKYMAIILRWGSATTMMNPSDISQIRLKIERGTSATPFTLAPEDVNGKIVNVETIANQTAKKFEWIVNGGDSSSNFTLTDRVADLVAERINFKGLVTFSGLNTDAKNEIGKVAQSKVDVLEVGGRNLARGTSNEYSTPYTNFTGSANTCFDIGRVYLDNLKVGNTITVHMYIKYDNLVAASGKTIQIWLQGYGNVTLWDGGNFPSTLRPTLSGSGVYELLYSVVLSKYHVKNEYWACGIRTDYIQSGSVQVKSFKVEKGNKATDWTPAPEDYLPQASLVSNWTTNTTWIDGGKIYTNSITADKIATDAIKSRNYISSGGTQGSFLNLSDGSFTSPNLSWDSNGNLIAKNANLSGQITATKGKIGSFNLDKSLYLSNNSPYYFSQFCAKKVYGLTNEGDIYIGSEGIYSYSWETGNMYIGDSGSIQADVSSSRGVCIENGEIYIYKSDYCKDYPTACDNKYGLVLTGGYVASANYSDGGSIDGFNFILTPNKFNINGKIYASNELQTGGDQIRIISGNIGCMVRNDSADFYILRTNSGDPYGGWTNDRPFRINWASNDITCGHNLTANNLIANSWVYCSEVHSSGAVVIASNSESYYWAHGYQIARGTSWGGVCIGDDSQGLRLYGTSIWASHSISTSDENLKENFTTLDQYEDFYMNLNPIGFNYIGDYDGKKTHFGFGAHKTEDILESEGYDSDKFAVVTHRPLVQEDIEKRFGKDVEVDIETEYGVSYTEFIALNTHMIQKTRKELEQVKQEKTDLEARLQAIEAKLGL
nr:MAG TPA: tail protein [Caudoviricetes sp.]